jgi:Holliday junction resolvasome RuvABC endonuclease subunit
MRYVRFLENLDKLHEAKPIRIVFFEEVRAHKGVDAAHVYGGLMATLQAWCEKNAIPYEGVPVGAIKKFATGKGNAGKPQMIAAAEDWGYSPASDDEADALALLHLKIGLASAPRGAASELEKLQGSRLSLAGDPADGIF